MRLPIKVSPRASKNELLHLSDGSLKARIKAPPVDGKANEVLIELLSKKYGVPKSRIKILRGQFGKNKLVEID